MTMDAIHNKHHVDMSSWSLDVPRRSIRKTHLNYSDPLWIRHQTPHNMSIYHMSSCFFDICNDIYIYLYRYIHLYMYICKHLTKIMHKWSYSPKLKILAWFPLHIHDLWSAGQPGRFATISQSYLHCIPILFWLVVLTILTNMKVNGKDYPIYYGK